MKFSPSAVRAFAVEQQCANTDADAGTRRPCSLLLTVAPKARTGNLAGIAANGPNKDHAPSTTGLGTTTTTQPSLTTHPTAKKVAFQETFHWTQSSKSKALVTSAICGFGKKIAKGMVVGTVLSHLAFKGSFVSAVSIDKFDAKDELDPNSVGTRTSQSTGEIRIKTFKEKHGTYLRTDSELDETQKNVNDVSVFPHVDEAWEAEMARALRNLEDEIEIVMQAMEIREANEEKDEDEEDTTDEDELEATENSGENYFVVDEGHGLLETVINNCTSISITFHSMNETTAVNFHDLHGCPGYEPAIEAPMCDKDIGTEEDTNFPVTCTYHMVPRDESRAVELTANNQGEEADMEEMLSGKKRGRRTKQSQWFAKAAKRISYGDAEGSCKPKYHGRAVRAVNWQFSCEGWEQKTIDCWKPCSHYNDGYTQTIGYHCWKPCDREGQLALNVGCGAGPYDRTCHANSGGCAMKWVNHGVSILDVVTTFLSGGVAGAFKTAIKTAVKAGSKVAAEQGLKKAIKIAAKAFAKSLMNSKAIKKKAAKFKKQFRKELKKEAYDQGSELFMASSINSGPDVDPLKILDEVAEAVDPTGIYGMVKGWIPPESCDDVVYLDEDIPDEEEGLPEIGPLDDDDFSDLSKVSWKVGGTGRSCAESCEALGETCTNFYQTNHFSSSNLKDVLDKLRQHDSSVPTKITSGTWKTGSGLNPAYLVQGSEWVWVLGKNAPDCHSREPNRKGLCQCMKKVTWTVGGTSKSCSESCGDIGKACSSLIRVNSVSELRHRLNQAGQSNPRITHGSWKTGSGLNPAYLVQGSEWFWVLGKNAPDCHSREPNRKGLCQCVGSPEFKLVGGATCPHRFVPLTGSWQECRDAAHSLGFGGDAIAHVDYNLSGGWGTRRPRGCFRSTGNRRFHFNTGAGGNFEGADEILCVQG